MTNIERYKKQPLKAAINFFTFTMISHWLVLIQSKSVVHYANASTRTGDAANCFLSSDDREFALGSSRAWVGPGRDEGILDEETSVISIVFS